MSTEDPTATIVSAGTLPSAPEPTPPSAATAEAAAETSPPSEAAPRRSSRQRAFRPETDAHRAAVVTAVRAALASPDLDPAAGTLLAQLLAPHAEAWATAAEKRSTLDYELEACRLQEQAADADWDDALDRLCWTLRDDRGAPVSLATLVGTALARAKSLAPQAEVALAEQIENALDLHPEVAYDPATRTALAAATTRLDAAEQATTITLRARVAATIELNDLADRLSLAVTSTVRTLHLIYGEVFVTRYFPRF